MTVFVVKKETADPDPEWVSLHETLAGAQAALVVARELTEQEIGCDCGEYHHNFWIDEEPVLP